MEIGMRTVVVVSLLLVAVLVGSGTVSVAKTAVTVSAEKPTPEQSLRQLLEGNSRFVKQQMANLGTWGKAASNPGTTGVPCAIILTCADARIPPELLFDKGIGCLFVLRVAGNIVNPAMLGSVEYAVEQLGVPLVMVLGHERCGVVTAAMAARGSYQGNLGSVLKTIEPAVTQAARRHVGMAPAEVVELAIELNAKMAADGLSSRSAVLKRAVEQKRIKIVAAKLDEDCGKVALLD
jgi:carbonic anhydrase